jgi:uncharacterized Zn finger protein
MQKNTCLETGVILKSEIRVEHYFEVIAALQKYDVQDSPYSELQRLLQSSSCITTNDFRDINDRNGDLHAILRLDGTGCRYWVRDASSIAKGVEVLSAVK